jgi:hypothetical protein
MEPLTGWLEYRLLTTKLDPPVFKCRLRPVNMYNIMDGVGPGGFKVGRATLEASIAAVAEWDLTAEGTPIPLTDENKTAWLQPIIAELVEGRGEGVLLGTAILMDAQNMEHFLKNSPPSSPGS